MSDRPMTPPSEGAHHPHPIFAQDEIDFRQLAKALWRYRLVPVVLSVAGVLAGAGISLYSTHYVQQGLFLTPDVNVSDYKPYDAALGSEPRMQEWLRISGQKDPQTIAQLLQLVQLPGKMAEAVRPVLHLTGRDMKVYDIDSPPETEDSGKLVGIQLQMAQRAKQDASPVIALSDYVRSSIIHVDLEDKLLDECLAFQTKAKELRNEEIKDAFSRSQWETKAATLRELIAATPGAAAIESRQVVALQKGDERFLSPSAQLVAAEVAIADLKLDGMKRERDFIAAGLKKDYYCGARAAQQEAITGQALLARLEQVAAGVFEGQDLELDIVEQTANEIDLQRQGWNDRYLKRMRFVVSPNEELGRRVRTPSLAVGVLLGGILGTLFGVLAALLLAWWHDNRGEVLAAGRDD